jgi:hypothetical protein
MNRIWDLIDPNAPNAPINSIWPLLLRSHKDLQQACDNKLLAEWTRAHKAWDEKGEGITGAEALAAYKAKELKKPPLSTYDDVDNRYNKLFKHYTTAAAAAKEHRLTI